MVRKGERVYFKPEWRDAGDDQIIFIALNDESMGRVDVQAQLGWTINPINTVPGHRR